MFELCPAQGKDTMEDINIALLIDADNISSKYISVILSELSKYGKITIRRMYGDWSQDRLRSWFNCSASYSLTPVMQPNNTPGKNASDIGLIIDAMDTLYTNAVQGFCIVSSDGDFNKLATRLREAGKVVIGMGEKKTPESFRASCERFIFLDVISGSTDNEEEETSSKAKGKEKKKPSGSKATAGSSKNAANNKKKNGTAAATPAAADPYEEFLPGDAAPEEPGFTDKADIEAAIVKMITDNAADGKETGLGEVGSRLVKIFPDFDIRNYHYSKLSEFLKDLPSLSVTTRDSGVWISQKITADSEIEKQILSVFRRHNANDLLLSVLKEELQDMNPNLDATIRKSGVTRFSVYLNRNIHSVEVNGRHVNLKK